MAVSAFSPLYCDDKVLILYVHFQPEAYAVFSMFMFLHLFLQRLHLGKLGAELTELSKVQADYISVPVEGPYKAQSYRY